MEGSWGNRGERQLWEGRCSFLGNAVREALPAGQEAAGVLPRGWQWPWACPVFLLGGRDGDGCVFLKLLC